MKSFKPNIEINQVFSPAQTDLVSELAKRPVTTVI